jgi:hypothetical protein
MAQYYRIAAIIEKSIETRKYERMLEEDERQSKRKGKPNRFVDDEALDESPFPPQGARKRKGRWIYELQYVSGKKKLRKWVRVRHLPKKVAKSCQGGKEAK